TQMKRFSSHKGNDIFSPFVPQIFTHFFVLRWMVQGWMEQALIIQDFMWYSNLATTCPLC
ncbi:hypothetical protein ACJX0J_025351, partial [Zea mays]